MQAASQIGSFVGPALGGIVADVAGFRCFPINSTAFCSVSSDQVVSNRAAL